MITKIDGDGCRYSSDFLNQMAEDLKKLAADFEKSGGKTSKAVVLLRAVNVVRQIEAENSTPW